jgi:hypothetical protein
MTRTLPVAARRLSRSVTTLLAIIGTTVSLLFGHDLERAHSSGQNDSVLSNVQVVSAHAAAPVSEANGVDLSAGPQTGLGVVSSRAFLRQHSVLAVLFLAPRFPWPGQTRCPEAPPRPVTLTSLCISQT